MDDSALARVEQQRVELESNIVNLRKSLRHWQTLEIDYQGLKEEFQGIPEDSSADECLQAAKDFKPDLLDDLELQALLRDSNSRPRRPSQLVDLLSKRVDYVSRNVEAVRKQLSDAEKKRNALLLAGEPDHRDEAGLPLAEITEELDDSGEVISSKVETPGSDAAQLIDVLKKAGVRDLEETNGMVTEVDPATRRANAGADSPEFIESNPDSSNLLLSKARSEETQQAELQDGSFPANPNDTEEEARLRREILEYSRGLDEVGAIVAELELEEDASDVSFDEDDDNFDLDSDLDDEEDYDDDESEDESGKSKNRLSVSRGYRKKMEELQEKLGLRNVGPDAETEAAIAQLHPAQRPPAAEAARKAAIARHEKAKKSSLKSSAKDALETGGAKTEKRSRKKVAFSTELDIASEQPATNTIPTSAPTTRNDTMGDKIRPINETIVERTDDRMEVDAPAPAPTVAKQSRFKAARQTQPQTPMFAPPMTFPTDTITKDEEQSTSPKPPSKISSTELVERPSSNMTAAPDLDDFSEEAHRRQIAVEYQRHRIKRIQSQEGGFLGDGEDDNYGEMITPQDDKGRKVSRFKAARVKR